MAPECLEFGVFGHAIGPFTLRTQPQPVDIAAQPTLYAPAQCAAAIGVLKLELVQHQEPVDGLVVDAVTWQRCKGSGPVGIGQLRYRGAAACEGGRPVIHVTVVHRAVAHGRVVHHRGGVGVFGKDDTQGRSENLQDVIHRRVPHGTCPSPCETTDGSGRPSGPRRLR
ncbi:hypothetical protein D3C81_1444630 [compost metagenome]